MSLRLYLTGIAIVAFSALSVWLWIIFTIDPLYASLFEFILFYTTFFIWMMGSLSLVFFYARLLKTKNEFYYNNLFVSVRQSSLLTVFFTVTLILLSLNIVTTSEIILLFLAIVLFEMYFLARK